MTYGYQASAFTTSHPEEALNNALVFCRVQSWLTGRRYVSLPFSDHCTPLVENKAQFACLWSHLRQQCEHEGQKYVEIRPAHNFDCLTEDVDEVATFCLHRLDLSPDVREIFGSFHESCVRRKIKCAQREGLCYEEGKSEEVLTKFYALMVLTRHRHQLPPQPLAWFRNLIACVGDDLKIRLVSHQGRPAAGVLTIRYKDTMMYKYGCSAPQLHYLGPMQLGLWNAIQEAKRQGLREFDRGRTEWTDTGLLKTLARPGNLWVTGGSQRWD